MEQTTLQTIWFILTAVLFTGYAILDGFDLGVGVLHLFARTEEERRINLNSIGPVWDGNEVWLITAGGALFAAFPPVYAAVSSGFYGAMVLLLVVLIGRAIGFDYRAKIGRPALVRFIDSIFGLSSLLIAFLLGVAFGNVLRGVPVDANGWYVGTFQELLNPYALLVGALSVALLTMHGATYLAVKTDGARREQLFLQAQKLWTATVILFAVTSFSTFLVAPHLLQIPSTPAQVPLRYFFVVLTLLPAVFVPVFLGRKRARASFVASSAMIAGMLGLASVSLFPRLVPSSLNASYDLTAFTHSSSAYTLHIMLIVALVGMPLAIVYKIFLYRTFRGKTVLTKDSY